MPVLSLPDLTVKESNRHHFVLEHSKKSALLPHFLNEIFCSPLLPRDEVDDIEKPVVDYFAGDREVDDGEA